MSLLQTTGGKHRFYAKS